MTIETIVEHTNHVWMMDVTEFKTLFGASTLHFAAVFDAFSRLPLVGMTFASKPGGTSMARLFKIAVAAFGWPKYVITDLGGEFIAGVFQKTVARLGVNPRFASADNIHATARLERFWKTLKQITGVRLVPPLNLADSRCDCRGRSRTTPCIVLIRASGIVRPCRRFWGPRRKPCDDCRAVREVSRAGRVRSESPC